MSHIPDLALAAHDDLLAEIERLRATNARLNRRAQVAEAALHELTTTTGRGKSRAVAAEVWERCVGTHEAACSRAREAEAQVDRLRAALEAERAKAEVPTKPADGLVVGDDAASEVGGWLVEAIRLTDAEYDVLLSAIAYYETVLEDDHPRRVPTLNRAADKLSLGILSASERGRGR